MAFSITELKCKNCGGTLEAGNIIERLAMARCGHCNSVFAIESSNPAAVRSERAKVPLPQSITTTRKMDGTLEIIRSWKSATAFILIFFTLFWNGFMLVWFTIAIASGAWEMALFGSIHAGIGLFLIYLTAASFLNRTYINVGQGLLSVSHKPLKWPGGGSYAATKIKQIYCKEKVSRNKNGTSTRYILRAITTDGTHHTILKGLEVIEQALFIEQQLEDHLRIRNEPVAGEAVY